MTPDPRQDAEQAARTAPTAAAFECDQITVEKGGQRILDAFTGTVPATVIAVLFGLSGAEKSTLLRLCNRLETPHARCRLLPRPAPR